MTLSSKGWFSLAPFFGLSPLPTLLRRTLIAVMVRRTKGNPPSMVGQPGPDEVFRFVAPVI
jgi:hypothetical protein